LYNILVAKNSKVRGMFRKDATFASQKRNRWSL